MDLIETVGARLVLMGRAEYLAGLKEAKAALADMGATAKEASAGSRALTDAEIAQQAAAKNLAAATKAAADAQLEYEAAAKAAAEAAVTDAETATEVEAAKAREAKARLDAAAAAREESLATVQAAKESKAATDESVATVEAAETRKAAAATAGGTALKTAAFGVVAVAGVVAGASVKMAADFQSSTERLVTSAGEQQSNLDMVRKGILDLAGQVGYSADDLSAAMYKVESGGQHGAAGLEVLKAAAQGAKTENADLTTVADAVTSVLQDYHLQASASADVTSKLVAATASGKMSFEELSGSLSSVLPVASAAHVSINDILGDVASMTVHGMSAQQATQNLADAIRKMQTAASSATQTKELAMLGIDARQLSNDLGTKGLSGTLQEVSQAIEAHMGPGSQQVVLNMMTALKGLPPAVQDLGQKVIDGSISLKDFTTQAKAMGVESAAQVKQFASLAGSTHQIGSEQMNGQQVMQNYTQALRAATGDATAMNVALMLTGENSQTTAGAIDAVSKATADGAGNVRGWDEIQGTFNQKLAQAKDSLGALAISIGTYLLPPLTTMLGWIAQGTTWLSQHQAVAMTLAGVIGVVLVGGLILATAAAVSFAAGIIVVDGALSPIVLVVGAVVLAIAALAAAAYFIITNWTPIKNFFIDIWNGIVAAVRPVIDAIVSAWNTVKNATVTAWNWVVGIVRTVIDGIVSFFQPLVDAIRSHWDEITTITRVFVGFLSAAFWPFEEAAKIIWGLIVGVLQGAWDVIVAVVKFAIGIVGSVLQTGWDIIKAAFVFTWDLIKTILQGAWDFIVGVFKVARDIVVGIITVFLDLITGNWSRAWTDIKNFASQVWHDITDSVTTYFSDLWNNVKRIAGDMWDGMKQIFTDLWHDLVGIFARGANLVIGVINGFLDIVNKVAGAIGFSINLHIDPIPGYEVGGVLPGSGGGVPMLASGGVSGMDFGTVGAGFMTNGPRAIVGEGNPLYPEYVIPTDPTHRGRALGLLQSLMGDIGYEEGGALPAGVPQYSVGGIIGGIWSGITNAATSVAHGFNAAVDWVGNAAKEGARKVVEDVWPALDVPANSFAGLVPATLNYWRNKALDWIDGKYQAQQQAAAAMTGAAGSAQVQAWVAQALQMMGLPMSLAPGVENIIMHESGGNPSAINLWDSNAKAGHPSQGLMQTIPSTFHAYVLPSLAGRPITDPIANITAGVRYALANYGQAWLASGGNRSASGGYLGYASGGVLPIAGARLHGGPVSGGWPYLVGEGGPELFVPGTDGHIVPNGMTADLAHGDWGTGGGGLALGTTVHIHAGAIVVHEANDPRASYEAVKQGIADSVARA